MPPRILAAASFCLLCAAPMGACAEVGQAEAEPERYLGELRFSEEEEAEYLRRYERSRTRVRGEDLYYPRGPLHGAADWEPLPTTEPDDRTISGQALAAASAYAAANNSSALLVWRQGGIELEQYFGDYTRERLVNSYSLAKIIAAFTVGRAMELGAIQDLDQPVADFVEEWRNDPMRSKILVRHLLDMRAGFFRQLGSSEPEHIISRSFLHPRSEEIIVREYPVVHEPGTRYEYNNAAYAMVAILIERATGRSYHEFAGTEILREIGAPGGYVWLNREGGVAQSGCCMLLPAETYLRLALLALHGGVWEGKRLLAQSFVTEMKTPTVQNPYYGLGVFVAGTYTERRGWGNPDLGLPQVLHSEPYLTADLFLFDGNMNQVAYIIPSQDMIVLRTGRMPPRSEGSEWDNSYLPNTLIRGIVRAKRESTPQPP
jgi:CubicO group peptidase (beta-lactamase class C family)